MNNQKIRVAFNGFGRIGRAIFKLLSPCHDIDIIGIQVPSLDKAKDLYHRAHALQYDPYYGCWDGHRADSYEQGINVDGKKIPLLLTNEFISRWAILGGADILIECTGKFSKNPNVLRKQISFGTKKTIVTYPAEGVDATIVYGVNHRSYISRHAVLSSASCTTNCIVPILSALTTEGNLQLRECMGTTIHAATTSQDPLEVLNQITDHTTGASKAVELILPHLRGRTQFFSKRVPIASVSCMELDCIFDERPSIENIHMALKNASEGRLTGILQLVSVPKSADSSGFYIRNPHSAVINTESIASSSERTLIKIWAWYDNEFAYSCRVVDLVRHIALSEKWIERENNDFIPEYIPRPDMSA